MTAVGIVAKRQQTMADTDWKPWHTDCRTCVYYLAHTCWESGFPSWCSPEANVYCGDWEAREQPEDDDNRNP